MVRVRLLALFALLAGPAFAVNDAAIEGKRPPKTLAEFGFFEDAAADVPSAGVVPYEVSSPLFTDYAEKARFVYVPEAAALSGEGLPTFPVGSALIKTFHYGDRKVETRVLVHRAAGWKGYPYVWNAEGTEARLKIAGADLQVETARGLVNYRVPNMNQCKACHVDAGEKITPIGPKLRNLSFGEQGARLYEAGVLAEMPDIEAVPDYRDKSVPLELRARAYLDANCGHCHAPGLPADTSGLYLNWGEDRPVHLGVGKRPVAAGRGSGGLSFDVVAGDAAASILHYRMISVDPGVMMPEIGRSMVHAEGVALIEAWIDGLE